MNVDQFGIRASAPTGWAMAVQRRAPIDLRASAAPNARALAVQDVTYPVLHVSSRALVPDVGDFGSGQWEVLGPEDVFIALIEYGDDVADVGLFETQGVPRLAPSQFAPNRMPRFIPGRSACQRFFSVGGRAFCLFAVIGDQARRMASVPRAETVVRTLAITDAATLRRSGVRR